MIINDNFYFRTSLPINDNEMGKKIKRTLNKPEPIQDVDDILSGQSMSDDPDLDGDYVQDEREQEEQSVDYNSGANSPPKTQTKKSHSKRSRSYRPTKKSSKKRRRADHSPIDSSDFSSSICEDEYDLIN